MNWGRSSRPARLEGLPDGDKSNKPEFHELWKPRKLIGRRSVMAVNLQLVVFGVGKELYGVGIGSVQEIVRVPDITVVPDAPAFLEGVINLRGKVIPVIDLRKRLRLQGKERTKSTRVLVTENEGGMGGLVGLLVDFVSEVRRVQSNAVEDPPEMVSAIGGEYITGVAKADGDLIILLDLKRLLSVDDMRRTTNSGDYNIEHLPEAKVA
jgi:purine-binding chemotaxis protein CheW